MKKTRMSKIACSYCSISVLELLSPQSKILDDHSSQEKMSMFVAKRHMGCFVHAKGLNFMIYAALT